MNQFETRFKNMLKNKDKDKDKLEQTTENQDSLNKGISLFQDELTQNINIQYKKEWKKLSKDCKISLLLDLCNQDNISNFDYLKKYINKLEIEYDQEKMIILKINNITKIEKKNSSSIELLITNLKIKSIKKNIENTVESELVEDI